MLIDGGLGWVKVGVVVGGGGGGDGVVGVEVFGGACW